ncbi:MAG: FAD-dependent oxidoreductase [Bryobacter sp.]|nr:FAD-dependent oxidoreductase [Bryobacter sp. CoA8 C33]
MVLERTEAANLVAPVAFSTSHVSYSTLHMEPRHRMIGQAEGIAAKLSIQMGKSVQEIDTAQFMEMLT